MWPFAKCVRINPPSMLLSHAFYRFSVFSLRVLAFDFPKDSMSPYVYLMRSVRCHFGYTTGLCGYRACKHPTISHARQCGARA